MMGFGGRQRSGEPVAKPQRKFFGSGLVVGILAEGSRALFSHTRTTDGLLNRPYLVLFPRH